MTGTATDPYRREDRPIRWPVVLALLVAADVVAAAAPHRPPPVGRAAGAQVSFGRMIFVHPEAFRVPTWIEVDLPASEVTLRNLRVLTANRSWTLKICGSPADPQTCSWLVGSESNPSVGWRGDYSAPDLNLEYTDLAQGAKLHLLVTPVGGDWMIFRVHADVLP